MEKLLIVFLGAGLGGVLRFLVGGLFQAAAPGAFPLGTLIVNITGCLAMGGLVSFVANDSARLFLLVGLLGGYTTFSAFGRETIDLLARGELARAGAYVILSNLLGFAAVWAGMLSTARFVPAKL